MRPNDTIIDEIDDAGRSSLEVDTSVVTAQGNETKSSILYQVRNILHRFFIQNQFIIMVLCAILLALAYPPLGADYLQPKITSTWIAVMLIFGTFFPYAAHHFKYTHNTYSNAQMLNTQQYIFRCSTHNT